MSYLLDYNPGAPQYTYPRRGGASLSGTAIIHTAECAMDLDGDDSSAEVCASFIANRSDYGSYHRLVDSDSIIDMVPWEYEAWQDSETNNWAVGISAAVQAGKWHSIPAARRDRIYRNLATAAADFVSYMRSKGVTVPLRRITGAQARARVPGFCAHGDSGLYRSDPGTQFDWALFFKYTQQALGGAAIAPQGTTAPKEWDEMASKQDIKDALAEALWAVLEGPRGKKAVQLAVWGFDGGKRAGKQVTIWRDTVDSNTIGRQLLVEVATLREIVREQAANPGVVIDYDEVQRRVEAGLDAKVEKIVQTQAVTTTEIELKKEAA